VNMRATQPHLQKRAELNVVDTVYVRSRLVTVKDTPVQTPESLTGLTCSAGASASAS